MNLIHGILKLVILDWCYPWAYKRDFAYFFCLLNVEIICLTLTLYCLSDLDLDCVAGAGSDGEDLDADLEAALDSQDNVSEKDGSIDGDSSRDSTRLEDK